MAGNGDSSPISQTRGPERLPHIPQLSTSVSFSSTRLDSPPPCINRTSPLGCGLESNSIKESNFHMNSSWLASSQPTRSWSSRLPSSRAAKLFSISSTWDPNASTFDAILVGIRRKMEMAGRTNDRAPKPLFGALNNQATKNKIPKQPSKFSN